MQPVLHCIDSSLRRRRCQMQRLADTLEAVVRQSYVSAQCAATVAVSMIIGLLRPFVM